MGNQVSVSGNISDHVAVQVAGATQVRFYGLTTPNATIEASGGFSGELTGMTSEACLIHFSQDSVGSIVTEVTNSVQGTCDGTPEELTITGDPTFSGSCFESGMKGVQALV